MRGGWLWRSLGIGGAIALVLAAGALAATRLASGHLYTGKRPGCASAVAHTTCVFRFRASDDGRALRFVGMTVLDTWSCRGGGGEALLGGRLDGVNPTPIPLVKVRGNGSLRGSTTYTLRSGQAPPHTYRSVVSGHVSDAGKVVVITFHDIYISSRGDIPCATRPVVLRTQ